MDTLNFKELTEIVALEEGLNEELSIAQIKEVTRIVLTEIANRPLADIVKLLARYEYKED